jgi:hypothetical protein
VRHGQSFAPRTRADSPRSVDGLASTRHPARGLLAPRIESAALGFGAWRLQLAPWAGLGIVVASVEGDARSASNYVDELLLTEPHRERFFALVDRVGLVVCKGVAGDAAQHREVRGRSSRGRLSPGELFHHDGCAGPVKPRVVEIRCPYQRIERHTCTAIAPFPEVVQAMLLELPEPLCTGELARWRTSLVQPATGGAAVDWEGVQGMIDRAVRRALPSEDQRAYLRKVDVRVGAYRERWEMGESRFIANSNGVRTMQHRRAYLEVHTGNRPNGRLVKRWPAEAGDALDREACEV